MQFVPFIGWIKKQCLYGSNFWNCEHILTLFLDVLPQFIVYVTYYSLFVVDGVDVVKKDENGDLYGNHVATASSHRAEDYEPIQVHRQMTDAYRKAIGDVSTVRL